MTQNSPDDEVESSYLAFIGSWFEWFFLALVYPLRWSIGRILPYGYHIVGSSAVFFAYLLVSLPFLVLGLLIASYSIGGPTAALSSLYTSLRQISTWALLIQSNPLFFSGAIVFLYFALGVLPYEPNDWNVRAWRTRNEPEPPYEWEFTGYTIAAILPSLSVGFVWGFFPAISATMPFGLYGLGLSGGLLAVIPFWLARRRTIRAWSDSAEEKLVQETLRSNGFIHLLVGLSITGGMVFVGTPSAMFLGMAVSMGWVARRFRWMLYEDRDGFVDFTVRLFAWGSLTRIPYAYALTVALIDTPTRLFMSPQLLGALVAPLAGLCVYLLFRYYRTGGRMYLRYPRKKFDPDDWDRRKFFRRVASFLSHEQSQALRPIRELHTNLRHLQDDVTELNRDIARLDEEFEVYTFKEVSNLTEDPQTSTYKQRKQALNHLDDHLVQLRDDIDETDQSYPDLRKDLSQLHHSVEESHELNEKIGRKPGERLVDLTS